MKKRSISRIVTSPEVMMGPIKLKQPLPVAGLNQIDPFLLLHHTGKKHQPAGGKNIMDVGAHPHRGFEPVSFIFEGEIHHKDSRGNDSVIGAGGVQWMTAGQGIIHSESAPKSFIERGGNFEMIQLWVNLPSHLKMVQPKYQGFQRDEIPAFIDQNEKARVNVISGKYKGLTGPIDSLTNISAFTIELKAGGEVDFDIPATENILLYQLRGSGLVNDESINDTQMVTFFGDGQLVRLEAIKDSLLLMVTGEPYGEKVVSWGPYVMNSQTEILEAMRDFQMGKMGVLV
ncbi:MAG: pirin family protein [Bacteroidota bacterium]